MWFSADIGARESSFARQAVFDHPGLVVHDSEHNAACGLVD